MAAPSLVSGWLENGDRLTRDEFHRRYLLRDDLKKADLIEGVVWLPSPVRATVHGDREGDIGTWLGAYRARHPELRLAHNATVILDGDNEVQPDLSLRRPEDGSSTLRDDYIYGPPELVVEIAAFSASIDLHDKKALYERSGVHEYIVWRVFDEAIDWWGLNESRYVQLTPDSDGGVSSTVFPGLRLDVAALLRGDLATVLQRNTGG